MTRRDHALFAAAAIAAFLVASFQVWYAALPVERAAGMDFCRWGEHLDCFESLHRGGDKSLRVLGLLAGVLLLEAGLAALSFGAEPSRGDAWGGIARLVSFPASGLAIYLLLDDYLLFKKTSPSAVLLALLSVGQNVLVLVRGRLGLRARDAGLAPVLVALAAAVFGFFVVGASGAARFADKTEMDHALAPPAVIIPGFETDIPRQGAVELGDPRARHEVLLFLDPAQEESMNVLRDALETKAEDVILEIYLKDRALPRDGRALLERVARGEELPPQEPSTLPKRHAAAAKITAYPTAIWKGGRQNGGVTLAQIVSTARTSKW